MESISEVKRDLMCLLDGEYQQMRKKRDYYEKGDSLNKHYSEILSNIKSHDVKDSTEIDKAINQAQTKLNNLKNDYLFNSFMISAAPSSMIKKLEEYIDTLKQLKGCCVQEIQNS